MVFHFKQRHPQSLENRLLPPGCAAYGLNRAAFSNRAPSRTGFDLRDIP
jgi:hypothetical protein